MGLFKRLGAAITGAAKKAGGVLRREKPAAPVEAPPAGPPTPPTGPPTGPPTPPEGPEQPEEEEGPRPDSLTVDVPGIWKISSTTWRGTVSGTLRGRSVLVFLDAMDAGDMDTAVMTVAYHYGADFADLLDLGSSEVHDIRYNLPGG